jgi:hypothetical protein
MTGTASCTPALHARSIGGNSGHRPDGMPKGRESARSLSCCQTHAAILQFKAITPGSIKVITYMESCQYNRLILLKCYTDIRSAATGLPAGLPSRSTVRRTSFVPVLRQFYKVKNESAFSRSFHPARARDAESLPETFLLSSLRSTEARMPAFIRQRPSLPANPHLSRAAGRSQRGLRAASRTCTESFMQPSPRALAISAFFDKYVDFCY